MRNQAFFEKIIAAGRCNEITRRDFISYSMLAGMTSGAAGMLWSNKVSAQTPNKGGTFRVGVHDGNTTDSLDPAKSASVIEIHSAMIARSFLTEITPENGLGPDLADSWSASVDAKQWVFQLNKNATFHDGRPVTANDVVASLNYHIGEKSTSAASALLADVTEVVADGDHTVTINLSRGFADLPWILTDYHLVICPATEDGGIDWKSGIGSGPYKITNFEPGVSMEFERHEGWHREGAHFDNISLLVLNDSNARQTALLTGSVDAVTLIDVKTMSLLQRNPNIVIDNIPSGQAITMPMHCDTPPYDDNNVRMALKHAINRQELVEKVLYGTGFVANDFHISPNMPYYPADIEQRTYDPDKAKSYLKKAGLDSLDVELSTTDSIFSGAVDIAVLFSEQAKAAGINIKVNRAPADGYWSDVWLKKPFCMVKWGARPTPDNMLTLAYKEDADWNEARWKNDRFNELLLQAKAELDDGLRAEMYHEMAVIARDDGGTILPFFANFVYARSNKVARNEAVASSWELDGGRAYHRWWFTS